MGSCWTLQECWLVCHVHRSPILPTFDATLKIFHCTWNLYMMPTTSKMQHPFHTQQFIQRLATQPPTRILVFVTSCHSYVFAYLLSTRSGSDSSVISLTLSGWVRCQTTGALEYSSGHMIFWSCARLVTRVWWEISRQKKFVSKACDKIKWALQRSSKDHLKWI